MFHTVARVAVVGVLAADAAAAAGYYPQYLDPDWLVAVSAVSLFYLLVRDYALMYTVEHIFQQFKANLDEVEEEEPEPDDEKVIPYHVLAERQRNGG